VERLAFEGVDRKAFREDSLAHFGSTWSKWNRLSYQPGCLTISRSRGDFSTASVTLSGQPGTRRGRPYNLRESGNFSSPAPPFEKDRPLLSPSLSAYRSGMTEASSGSLA
jgi:hypothetical protein